MTCVSPTQRSLFLFAGLLLVCSCAVVEAFQPVATRTLSVRSASLSPLYVVAPGKDGKTAAAPAASSSSSSSSSEDAIEATTEKYGLEVGLFESIKQKDGGESAKSLLKKYGIAYLATSIPLAIISFTICYLLVDSGVDMGALLAKIGIESEASEKAGTFAIAYAAHKAASPIRFPPTVMLTPVVAKLIGKEPELEAETTAAEEP